MYIETMEILQIHSHKVLGRTCSPTWKIVVTIKQMVSIFLFFFSLSVLFDLFFSLKWEFSIYLLFLYFLLKVLWLSGAIETLNRKHTNNANDLLPLDIFAIEPGIFHVMQQNKLSFCHSTKKNAFIRCNRNDSLENSRNRMNWKLNDFAWKISNSNILKWFWLRFCIIPTSTCIEFKYL